MHRAGFVAIAILAASARAVAAQDLSRAPVSFWSGRLMVGGDLALSIAPEDRSGYFNYTDYAHDLTRLVRLSATSAFRPHRRIAFLGEVRTENFAWLRPYALYAQITPWPGRAFDLLVGRIPPAFGGFARRGYTSENPVIGFPLAYQYLTSIRPDAIPASADELLRMRGRGWLAGYTLGRPGAAPGSPLVSALRWDTGVQARLGSRPVELTAALTTGTLSNPRVDDDNDGRQVAARLAVQPTPSLAIAASAARGEFLAREAVRALPRAGTAVQITVPAAGDDPYGSTGAGTTTVTVVQTESVPSRGYRQQAYGIDAEFSQGYWLLRVEAIRSLWTLPAVAPPRLGSPLAAMAIDVEGRYKILPGVYLAGRIDRLTFSTVTGSAGAQSWDAPVTRLEVGGGVSLSRHLLWKAAYQGNWRDGGRIRTRHLGAVQLVAWF